MMQTEVKTVFTTDEYIKNTLKRRDREAHKGDFGRILIYAGSAGMAGAAVLCGRSALKSGAGLVQYLLEDLSSPLLPVLQTCVPEATCIPMSSALKLSAYSAVIAGSGLGKSPGALKILTFLIETYTGVLVLDADALNMISCSEDLADKVRSCRAQIIITPHIGEAKRLLHISDAISGSESRIRAACSLAEHYRCISVLKGSGTLVCAVKQPAGSVCSGNSDTDILSFCIYQNTTGNPGMATAGSGDSLAGLIGSLAAQGYPAVDAARMGVFIHGKAGDLAAEELGEMGLTSSDIVSYIPYALRLYY